MTPPQPPSLAHALLSACGRADEPVSADFEARLATLVAHAQAVTPSTGPWPDPAAFASFLGARLQHTPLTQLETLAIDDLARIIHAVATSEERLATGCCAI